MRFPEAPEPTQATDGDQANSVDWAQQPHTNPTPSRKPQTSHRVLIVDDEPEVLRALAKTMSRDGFEVSCAESLEQGVATLHASEFDLVLTDLYLGPNDLGSKIAESAQSLRPAPPVIVLTGKPSFDGAQAAMRHHVADMVVKPVDPHNLLATCRRVLQEAELERRNRELESVNEVLASVIPRTIEIKDPTTSGHAARVVGYTDHLAQRCGVSEEDRASLRLASLLHDVGKIGIPDNILQKPGALTVDEREVINRHPQMGYEVLRDLNMNENIRLWVYQHHERWDGKGYPNRLAGEDVALPGRILMLAEVYDALAEARSYKPAWPTQKIVDLFRAEAGRQFDPELANLVADGLEKKGGSFFAQSPDMLF
jgi:putative two-component system response regulator